jgi:ABC-2 type transport system ATP-binding protein
VIAVDAPPFDPAGADGPRHAQGERPGATPPLLSVSRLSVRRGAREVLREVSLSVNPGEIVGVLGPNGAGKSTLFAILAGLLPAQGGALRLGGRPIDPGARALRAAAGIVFQASSLDGKLSAEENLRLSAALHLVPRGEARARAARLLAGAGLASRAREPVERLSGGMRRRVELAAALVHAPALLVMDEPTTGLDAASFLAFWAEVEARRREQGLTVVLATHRPEEAERCDRLVVLSGGRVVADEPPAALRARVAGEVVVVEAEGAEAVAAELRRRLGLDAQVRAGAVHVEHPAGHTLVPRIVEAFPAGRLQAVSIRRPTLADAYLALTGASLEPGEAAPAEAAA